jgi:hypothetical protein
VVIFDPEARKANMSKPAAKTKTISINDLNKRLTLLQSESAVLNADVIALNKRDYTNISKIYVWWRAATTIKNYLEQAYSQHVTRRVNTANDEGLNFKKLLYLMYGNYNIDKDSLDRKNRVLISLHKEYEKNKQHYEKDGVAKLAAFVATNGGEYGLIASAKGNLNIEKNTVISKPKHALQYRVAANVTDAMREMALKDEALDYFDKRNNNQAISITPSIVTNKQGFGVALVKRTATGYEVFGATDNEQGIRALMVEQYCKQYAALPNSMRSLFETIKTQTLTANTQKLHGRLLEASEFKHDDNTKKKVQRRVIYVAKENALVLSPVFGKSGVVTQAKLKHELFEGGASDCLLPTRCLRQIELRLLSTYNFNLFKPNNTNVIPKFPQQGLASHLLRLDNKADEGSFMFLDFWQFEAHLGQANKQLQYVANKSQKPIAYFRLSQSDFKTLAIDHINKWLASYGDNLTRPSNKYCEFGVTHKGFEFKFEFDGKAFLSHNQSNFNTPIKKAFNYTATFLTHDLCLAIHSLGEIEVIGDIELTCLADVLVLSYETDTAAYTVAIPTTTNGKRNATAFSSYSADITDMVKDDYDSQSFDNDMVLEQALAESNKTLTDDEIDKMLGLDVNDYDEILDGWAV